MLSGIVWFQIVPRKTAEIMSAAPARAKKSRQIQIERDGAGERDAGAVRHRRQHDGAAVSVDPRGPAARARSRAAPRRSRRSRAAPAAAASPNTFSARAGNSTIGIASSIAIEVDDVGAEQVAAAERVAQPLLDAAAGSAARSRRRAGSAASRRRASRRRRGRRCRPGSTSRGRTHATSTPPIAGPTSTPDLHAEAAQGVGGDDLVVPDGARQQRLAGGSLERRGRGQQPRHEEDLPQPRVRGERVDREPGGERGLRDAGPDQQQAPVDVVGERAAVQPEDDRAGPARPGRRHRPRGWSR